MKDHEAVLAKALTAVVHLNSRVSCLEAALAFLWKESGRDPAELSKLLDEEARSITEKVLLEIGDSDPDFAEIADILKLLERGRQ